MCAEGKLCVSKRVPTPAPGATKEPFFAHQWLPLTPGPLPLEGMSGFPRWHTETAIRGRKPGAGASWESCQGRGVGGGQRGHEAVFCVLNSAQRIYRHKLSKGHIYTPAHTQNDARECVHASVQLLRPFEINLGLNLEIIYLR